MAGRNHRPRRPRGTPPSNVASGTGDTTTRPRSPGVSHPPASGGAQPPGGGKFSWNGRGGHSKSWDAHLRAVARKRIDRDPLYDPTTQLAGSDLSDAANALTGLEFDPQETALRQALSDATTQGTALAQRAQDYQGQLGAVDAGIPAQQQAIAAQLKTDLTGNADAARTSIQGSVDDASKRAAANAATLGSMGADNRVADEGAAQQGRVAQEGQAAGDAASSASANWQNLAALSATARRQQGGEVQRDLLTRLANAQTGIRGQQTSLAAERGAATTKNLTQLRQQAFENLITQKGLGIKQEDIASQERQTAARLEASANEGKLDRQSRERIARQDRAARVAADREARSGKSSTVNKYGYTNGQWLKLSVSERQGVIRDFATIGKTDVEKDPKMSAAAQAMVSQIENAVSDATTDAKLQRHVHETGPRLTQIYVHRGMPPLLAQAAAEIARYRKLKPTTRAALERSGVIIPAAWGGSSPNLAQGTGNPASAVGTGLG